MHLQQQRYILPCSNAQAAMIKRRWFEISSMLLHDDKLVGRTNDFLVTYDQPSRSIQYQIYLLRVMCLLIHPSRKTAAVYPDFPVLALSAEPFSQQFDPYPVSYFSRNCELITTALHVSFLLLIALYWLQASTHCSRVYAVKAMRSGLSSMLVLSRQL